MANYKIKNIAMNSFKIFALGIIISSFIISCSDSDPEAFAYGNFESDDVSISSETSGKILQMSINEGDKLNKGDNIALIDTTQLYLKSLQLKASRKGVASRLNQLAMQKEVNKVSISILEKEALKFRPVSSLNSPKFPPTPLKYDNGLIRKLSVFSSMK